MRKISGLPAGMLACLLLIGLAQPERIQAQSSASPGKSDLTVEDRRLIAQGYTLKYNKGTKVFCKLETELSSRFQKSVCMTAEELRSRAETAKDAISAARRTSMPPR